MYKTGIVGRPAIPALRRLRREDSLELGWEGRRWLPPLGAVGRLEDGVYKVTGTVYTSTTNPGGPVVSRMGSYYQPTGSASVRTANIGSEAVT